MDRQNAMIEVPKYNTFTDEYRESQKEFYAQWVKSWQAGEALDIAGQYSYLFIYIRSLVKKGSPQIIIKKLTRLQSSYPPTKMRGSESFHSYCNLYISDAHIWLGNLSEAIAILYEALPTKTYAFLDNLLSLKYHLGEDISGREILRFYHAKTNLTKFGRARLDKIEGCIDLILAQERQAINSNVLENWLNDFKKPDGLPLDTIPLLERRIKSKIPYYYIDYVPEACDATQQWVREAENMLREMENIPRIGEGWVSETELYYEVKKSFPNLEVIQHASPKWLGRQHLDIYISKLKIAIEYQGKQHDEPVEFFGGEVAFQKTKERDERKRLLCHENNIHLIYVYPDYKFNDVLDQINSIKG